MKTPPSLPPRQIIECWNVDLVGETLDEIPLYSTVDQFMVEPTAQELEKLRERYGQNLVVHPSWTYM